MGKNIVVNENLEQVMEFTYLGVNIGSKLKILVQSCKYSNKYFEL